MKVIVIGTLPMSLINFRGKLIEKLVSRGINVVTLATDASPEDIDAIKALNVHYIDYPVKRSSLNPFGDIKTFLSLFKILNKEKPDLVLAYTIKPVIWAGLAARLLGIDKFYGLITGLGYAFQTNSKKRKLFSFLVKILYSISLKRAKGVIFQNPDNMDVFEKNGIVANDQCFLVNGSGVDLTHYVKEKLISAPRFLLIGRLLGEKGIREYVSAARIVKRQYPHADFNLVGPEDPSPDGILTSEINKWVEEGIISYMGGTLDVRPHIANCSIYVLPSYHEGMPRTVLEAMAAGRPIITTDVPGCRETVKNGVNGWLVDKQNVEQLVEKINWFIENPNEWQRMGDASIDVVKEKFDVMLVNDELFRIMELDKI